MHAQRGGGAGAPWTPTPLLSLQAPAGVAAFAALPGGSRCALGGDGKDVVLYDVAAGAELLRAKPPPKDWLGMYQKVYVAALQFLGPHAPDALLAGGEAGSLRLFDFRAQRRAVRTLAFAAGGVGDQQPGLVTALALRSDGGGGLGGVAFAGTSRGQLAQFDLGTGKLIGTFKGCSGGVRALALHPSAPLLAATGLDRHVRVFAAGAGRPRTQLAALYVKQPCTAVAWDARGAAQLQAQAAQAQVQRAGAAEADAEAAAEAAPRQRKHKRTSALLDAYAAESARWRRATGVAPPRAGSDDGDAPEADAEAAARAARKKLKLKKLKARRADGMGLQLNVAE